MSKENTTKLLRILLQKNPKTHAGLNKIKRKFARDEKISAMVTNAELLSLYQELLSLDEIADNPSLRLLLKKRAIRTLSGVAPIAVLTKSYPCPGKCAFCPTEAQMPKSYLSNEPAVMRAVLTKFDPFKQVSVRLKALADNGHATDKIELIVMGGTWSCLPKRYQTNYIKRCFDAGNGKVSSSLKAAQKLNETAKHRIVGVTLETRPDYITEEEIKRYRLLGCTKVEIGIQTTDDNILKLNKRGHGRKEIIRATKLLKDAGFKVAYHLMPNLPGATPKKDLEVFQELFSNPDFQPDMLKIYPCVVVKGSELYNWWRAGKYKPYTDKQLVDLLLKIKLTVPDYVRIIRLIRDIPKESIEAGNVISNLRQYLKAELAAQKKLCKCTRCREARTNISRVADAKLFTRKYQASGGTEYFLQFASKDQKILYAFLRLRLPSSKDNFIPELKNAALIREVHTYGRLVPIAKKEDRAVQHLGFGSKLMKESEKIAKKAGYDKMAVISGVGVRGFYRKLGYKLQGTYMVKNIKYKVKMKNDI
ncbi:MAG: elongator complex protein 3 [Patescibacteria group bacterium]